jgi:hypothetical protein
VEQALVAASIKAAMAFKSFMMSAPALVCGVAKQKNIVIPAEK